jgi:hypothetical protein
MREHSVAQAKERHVRLLKMAGINMKGAARSALSKCAKAFRMSYEDCKLLEIGKSAESAIVLSLKIRTSLRRRVCN